MKTNKLPKEVFEAACDFKLLKKFDKYNCIKITDGVSSDIWHVKTAKEKEFCIKRALAKLTVKEDWYAPVNRSNFEAIYFKYCKKIAPDNFPKVLGHDNKKFILAIEWYNPKQFEVWKKKLFNKNIELKDAENVSNLLLEKHKNFFNKKIYKIKFSNDNTFHSIRIEPYILFTSKKYPQFNKQFSKVAKSLLKNKKTLIHGDFSPKNILINANKPVILDAETACWGDPVFDLAFCNNHLLLKSLLQNGLGNKFLHLSFNFISNYIKKITWEEKKDFTDRLFDIIPLLLLARVDGKSPVEYFNLKQKNRTRALAKEILNTKIKSLKQLYFICNNYV